MKSLMNSIYFKRNVGNGFYGEERGSKTNFSLMSLFYHFNNDSQ